MANELKKLLDSHLLKLRKRPVEDRPVKLEFTADMEHLDYSPTIRDKHQSNQMCSDEKPIIPKSAHSSSSNNYIKVIKVIIVQIFDSFSVFIYKQNFDLLFL